MTNEDVVTTPAPTIPNVDMKVMCTRIDGLCGSWDDTAVAHRFGVDFELVVAIRQRRDVDPEHRDLMRLIFQLALATGASTDWILGWTDVIVRRTALMA
jgi:hypothetical protein